VSGAGHTPGRWEHDDVFYNRDFRTFVNVVSDSQSSFVACVSADPMHRDTIVANARLIAAAPDLLSQLEDCVTRLRACAKLHGNADWAVDQMCAPFDAAIARAEGREP